MTFAEPGELDADELAAAIAAQNADELRDYQKHMWAWLWMAHPHLAHWARPLHAWLDEPAEPTRDGAMRATADAALRHGLIKLTGDRDRRQRSDILGALLEILRSPSGRDGLGAFHTPLPLADAIVHGMLSELPPPGTPFREPAVGSGIMFCAAASRIRALGGDPANYRWRGTELDPVAAATCAVNAALWGLGGDVLIMHGDEVAEPDIEQRFHRERDAIRAHHQTTIGKVTISRVLAGVRQLVDLANTGPA
ncbi:N-6 DNA methylase [Embleya sp. NPDC059237]|uniref:N-6 DNA methylase n=1 Tax=Embleya sp. NPDC059237 TaxID=3346784 RepID=UPI0036AF4D5A